MNPTNKVMSWIKSGISFFRRNSFAGLLATVTAAFIGMCQIWLLYNQNQLIQQQNRYIESQSQGARLQTINQVLGNIDDDSEEVLAITQLITFGREGFDVLLNLSKTESKYKNISIEVLTNSNLSISHSQKVEIYIALVEMLNRKLQYYKIENIGESYYYLKILNEFLEETELENNIKPTLEKRLTKKVNIETRKLIINIAYFDLLDKEDTKALFSALEASPYYENQHSHLDKSTNDFSWAGFIYHEMLLNLDLRISDWCGVLKNARLSEILLQERRDSLERNEVERIDRNGEMLNKIDPWRYDDNCKSINVLGYHEDGIEKLEQELYGRDNVDSAANRKQHGRTRN